MKFFIDTEFAENTGTIKLISIGIISERGDTFYAENADFNADAANPWVKQNVLPRLKYWGGNGPMQPGSVRVDATLSGNSRVHFHKVFGSSDFIKKRLLQWMEYCYLEINAEQNPEFWAYFADYDWVVFCWLFGSMIDLPKHFPKFCLDLKQEMHTYGLSKEWKQQVCPDPTDEHNALEDARWNLSLYQAIHEYKKNLSTSEKLGHFPS